jgi:hypothetical protein
MIPQIALYALGAGLQGVQAFQAQKQQKKAQQAAQKAINELKQIKEVNPFAALQVPTMGAQLQQDALARATAGGVQAAQSAGAEGVIGGIGNLVGGVGAEAARIGAGLQKAEYQRDLAQAGQEAAIGQRAAEREFKIGATEAAGAQARRAEQAGIRDAAITGIGGSLTGLAGLMTEYQTENPYGYKKGASQNYSTQNMQNMTPEQIQAAQAFANMMMGKQ